MFPVSDCVSDDVLRFGRLEITRSFGDWAVSGGVTASGERFDSTTESAASRLAGYAIADAIVAEGRRVLRSASG